MREGRDLCLNPALDVFAFYANGKPKTPNKTAGETAMTARLWRVSADLVA